MIRFKKSFFDPYYKESFYKDLAHKTLGSAIPHLFVACLFVGFFASMTFYLFQKDKVETFILSTIDTTLNQYPYSYKVSINQKGELESNINPMYFFDTHTVGKNISPWNPTKLIVVDSNGSIKNLDVKSYNAHYLFLRDGYMTALSGQTTSYKGFEGFSLSQSKLEIFLGKVRSLVPIIPRLIALIIFFAIFLCYPVAYLIKSFIIALLLYVLFVYVFKEKITYKNAYVLSVFAGGTVLVLEILALMTNLHFPYFEYVVAVIFVLLMHRNASYFPIKRKTNKAK